jgi:hypothetical protein
MSKKIIKELRLQEHEMSIKEMPEPRRFSEGAVQKATADIYIRELRKFWRKKLSHIKKPRERKRDIVNRHVFATMKRHKLHGKPSLK